MTQPNPTPWTPPDIDLHWQAWGCNCGPAALAAITAIPLERIREVVAPRWRGYMPFGLMQAVLGVLRVPHMVAKRDFQARAVLQPGNWSGRLSLIQWGGQWLRPGVPVAAALSHTHWIAYDHASRLCYDVNADGWISVEEWRELAVELMATVRGCDGTWTARGTILIDPGKTGVHAGQAIPRSGTS
jgi:hypothetical protein